MYTQSEYDAGVKAGERKGFKEGLRKREELLRVNPSKLASFKWRSFAYLTHFPRRIAVEKVFSQSSFFPMEAL